MEGLRKQMDENNMQREQIEKNQMSIGEEIRTIRGRLDVDAANINMLTTEVRQRTRKLEDDQRLTVTTFEPISVRCIVRSDRCRAKTTRDHRC